MTATLERPAPAAPAPEAPAAPAPRSAPTAVPASRGAGTAPPTAAPSAGVAPREAPPLAVRAPAAGPPTLARLAVHGDLDRPAGREVVAQVQQAAQEGATRVVLDLSGVTAMDGYVAHDLLWEDWRLAGSGASLRLVRPSRRVDRALRWYGAGHLVVR